MVYSSEGLPILRLTFYDFMILFECVVYWWYIEILEVERCLARAFFCCFCGTVLGLCWVVPSVYWCAA